MEETIRETIKEEHVSQGVRSWMADWVESSASDWLCVPDDLESACRFDREVTEVVARTIRNASPESVS